MASLVRTLDEHGERHPDQLACVVGSDRCSYGELAQRVRRFATALLRLGLKPGDRVSLQLPNSVDYVVCFYGAMRAGMVANPINCVYTPREVAYMLDDSAAAMLISTPELLAGLVDVLPAVELRAIASTGPAAPDCLSLTELLDAPDDPPDYPDETAPACLPYSSGTTGRSKGIVHSHDSLGMQATLSANHLQMRPSDVLVQALPLVHLYPGNIIMGGLFTAAATMVVQPTFDPPSFVDLLGRWHATACAGVPTTYAMLCQLPDEVIARIDLAALQIAYSAGASLAGRVRSEFLRKFGARVLDCYGITEAAGNLAANLRFGEAPELSCGVPYPLTELRIVDDQDTDVGEGEVGELIARGPQIMRGYWNRPEDTNITLRGGWLHTGDLARKDSRGFVYIVDRAKDMILTGGYNVYPAEVEEVLQSHPDVAMCAVFAVPDAIKGEKPWAAIVPRSAPDFDVAAVESHCRTGLAPYKVPRRFLVVDDLPRNSVGKILRRELRNQYAPAAGLDPHTPEFDPPTPV